MRCMAKGQTVTPTLLTMICKRCSKEAILHRELGVSVKLLRAGAAYEKRLAEYRNDHASAHPSRPVRERLWDEAVDAHIHGQMERGVSSLVFLPYHDGRNSRPGSSNLLACRNGRRCSGRSGVVSPRWRMWTRIMIRRLWTMRPANRSR